MIERILRRIAGLTLRHPGLVLLGIAVLTVAALLQARHLEMRTDLIDLLGGKDAAETRLLRDMVQTLGYGNQLFVIIETPGATEEDAEAMERAADRLSEAMSGSGLFKYARSGLADAELLDIVRLHAWHFPSFVDETRQAELRERLRPVAVRRHVRSAAAEMVTPFSPLAPEYFTIDPIGVLDLAAPGGELGGALGAFDREWGSGNRFFSRDHKALLVVAEPRLPATEYAFALDVVSWTRQQIAELAREAPLPARSVRMTLAGAHVYAEEDRRAIDRNIWVASTVAVLGTLALCLTVYRWLSALFVAILPTTLGILWTMGVISVYPGEINLLSLAFIAILAGLGDDQVTYFFSRVPDEGRKGRTLEDAITATYLTTGRSVLFCILTTGTATLSLALARFRGLADLGLVLTIGLLALLFHTLFTVPALIHVWWKWHPAPVRGQPFRFLPRFAAAVGRLVSRRPLWVVAVACAVLVTAIGALPRVQFASRIEGLGLPEDMGLVGQRLLAERFGLEGAPTVLILEGDEASVLSQAERLSRALTPLVERGTIRAFFSPSSLLPSPALQQRRRAGLPPADLEAAAGALEQALYEMGFVLEPFQPALARLREMATETAAPLTLDEVQRALPPGLIDATLRRVEGTRCVAAVTVYSKDPEATATLPPATLAALKAETPFTEFSYDTLGRDLQAMLAADSARALLITSIGIVVIVVAGFRSVRLGLLVLMPIAYAAVVTVGVLTLAGHRFTGMALSALPLVIGIGIDNGIHFVRRHLESSERDVPGLIAGMGAPLIQTNLTTIIGFGALMTSTFGPLAEMGLLTAVGVGITLLASLVILPSLLALPRFRGWLLGSGSRAEVT